MRSGRSVVGVTAVVVLLLLAGACSGGGSSTAQPTNPAQLRERRRAERRCARRGLDCPTDVSPTTEALPPVSEPATTGPLKAPVKGLLDRDGPPPPAYAGAAVRGFVVKAYWRDLQPNDGGPLAAGNVIDTAIAQVRQLNTAHPGTDMGLKVRLYAGVYAPQWAKSLGGAPVNVTNPQSHASDTIGRFWTDAFGRAYNDLETKLAERYDAVPEVREVVISRCTTFFAEPFIRDKGDKPTVANLLGAGFTVAADLACHQQEIAAHKVWQQTRSDLELNPYQNITKKGAKSVDEAFTESMMRMCRSTLGRRCVLENNSLASPPKYPAVYAAMKALGAPISFQTATANKIGDLQAALHDAVSIGASSVELPGSYESDPPDALAGVDAALAQNPVT
jgi:hypothetical protein